jgi:hypothetical protein
MFFDSYSGTSRIAGARAAAFAAVVFSSGANAVSVSPLVAGSFNAGNGANSTWVQVDDEWRGSTFGSETWGTGIWGIADAETVLDPSFDDAVRTYTGVVPSINYGDQEYIVTWGPTWGTPNLAPLFSGASDPNQDNYAVRFTGFISITEAGDYNFGVLNDDGFRLTLTGSSGPFSIERDGLNPRDRIGYAEDFSLTEGLYQFDLLGYERLETGVIDLAWTQADGEWQIIPQSHLYSAVPLPGAGFLFGSGATLLALLRRRRRCID